MKQLLINISTVVLLISISALSVRGQDYDDPQNMSVKSQHTNCKDLPQTFASDSIALNTLKGTKFHLQQHFETTRKSGLMGASFGSCDFKTGYLIVTYDGQDIIYPTVSVDLWQQFQKTSDIDGFYSKNIKPLPSIP